MNTARAQLKAILEQVLPESVSIVPYQKQVDGLTGRTVMIVTKDVNPSPIRRAAWEYTFSLYVLTPLTTSGAADDDLDEFLEDVLAALESSVIPNGITWTTARRATFEGNYPAFEVDLTALITRSDI